jgi:hypothetical protein
MGFLTVRQFVLVAAVGWGLPLAAQIGPVPPSITGLQSSPVGTGPANVTAITSGSPIGQFLLYINGAFSVQVPNTVSWTDLSTGITTPLVQPFVTATQIQAIVPGTLFAKLVSSPVPVTITVVQSGGQSATANFTINPPLTAAVLTGGTVNQPYAATPLSSGGTLPQAAAPIAGLPPGITLQPNTNLISGTPTTTGLFGFSPVIQDFWGNRIQPALTLQIVGVPVITSLSPGSAPAGSAGVPVTVNGSNFLATSVVVFNGVSLATTFVNGALLATVPANLLAFPGSFPVVVTNPGGSASAPVVFTVTSTLGIATTSLSSGTVGTFYSFTLTGKGGVPPYTWTVTGLPAGLGTAAQSGVISGIPQQTGTFIINVTLKDSVGSTAGAQFPLPIVAAPISISTPSLPNGTVGIPYAAAIAATGGSSPYVFSLNGGTLPNGLFLSAAGSIAGTPTTPGAFNFTVLVADAGGATASRGFGLTVQPAPLTVGSTGSNNGIAGVPLTITFTATGGVPPYRFTATGTIPPGTTFNNGVLSGTPTTSGAYTFRVTVTDSTNTSSSADVTVVIAPPALGLTGTVANGQVGVPYSGQLTGAGGTPPYTYSVTGLPDGLSLAASGAISGTPATEGQYSVGATVTDSSGAKAGASFSVTIAPAALAVTTSALPDGVVNSPYAATLAASGGVKPYTWSVSGLPDGLTATAAGAIGGTPSAAGKFTVSASVKDSAGAGAVQSFSVTIVPAAITITTANLPGGVVGTAYAATLGAAGGVPPFTWSATGLPAGLTLSAAGVISGNPAAAGAFTVTAAVKDSAGTIVSKALPLTIGLPAAPPLNFSGISAISPPLQQPQVQVSLGAAYPVDVIVTLTLSFAPDSGADDPTIVFSTGGRTARITIPAGSTTGATSVGVQTGSVAGLITITGQLQATGQDVTPTPAPRSTIRIAALAPVATTVTAVRTTGGFTVTVTGYVTDREMTQGLFTFNAAPGGNLQTTSLTIPLDTIFAQYFASAGATPFGSQFTFTQPFTVTGSSQAVASVTVTLVNKIGQSTAATAALN